MDLVVGLAIASIFASILLWLFMPPIEPVIRSRVLLFLISLVPFIGQVFYFWYRNWPSELPWNLSGRGGGIAGRHLSESISKREGGVSFDQNNDLMIKDFEPMMKGGKSLKETSSAASIGFGRKIELSAQQGA